MLHSLVRGITHHIPAHAVDFVLLEPVLNGIHHQLLSHLVVGSEIVGEPANELSAWINKVIIVRHYIVQKFFLRHMRIHHIQNNTHSGFMYRINQAFQFFNSQFRIFRILRVCSIRREIVLRVISPVVFVVLIGVVEFPLSHLGLVTIIPSHNWKQLDMSNSKRFEVVKLLLKCLVRTPSHICKVVSNRRIRGKVTNVNFIDNSILAFLIAFDIGIAI
ncbi:hypothetical protein D3C86_944630 [compost metagenome]